MWATLEVRGIRAREEGAVHPSLAGAYCLTKSFYLKGRFYRAFHRYIVFLFFLFFPNWLVLKPPFCRLTFFLELCRRPRNPTWTCGRFWETLPPQNIRRLLFSMASPTCAACWKDWRRWRKTRRKALVCAHTSPWADPSYFLQAAELKLWIL